MGEPTLLWAINSLQTFRKKIRITITKASLDLHSWELLNIFCFEDLISTSVPKHKITTNREKVSFETRIRLVEIQEVHSIEDFEHFLTMNENLKSTLQEHKALK